MKTYRNYLIGLLILAGLALLFYQKVYLPKTTYNKFKPEYGPLQVTVFGIGNVGAKNIYTITAQTDGRILQIHTDEGKWVKKGDLLAEIDPVDLPQMIEQARIGQRKAKLEVTATQKELQSLQAQQKLARVTFQRYEKLHKESFASQAEYDKAKADLAALNAQIEATRAHIASAQLESKRAAESVRALEVKRSRYRILSPVNGYVVARMAEPAQTLLPSQSILKIVDPKTVWVRTYIDEKISGDIRVGQHAKITLRSRPSRVFAGEVRRIVAQNDPVTLEREVDVAFEKLPMPFYINEQAEVSIDTKHYDHVLKIPTKLLAYRNKRPGVWTMRGGSAHFVPLKIIARGNQKFAIEGIDQHAVLLEASLNKKPLKEGMKVH